jgi:transcriptional regulator with XRE-family HTH domain
MTTIHERIRMRREELKMSRADLGRQCDCSQQAVYGWEETDTIPTYRRLQMIAVALNTTVEWLTAGIDVNVPLAAKYSLIPLLGHNKEGDKGVDYHDEIGEFRDDEHTFAYRKDFLQRLKVRPECCRVYLAEDDSMALGDQLLIDLEQTGLEDGKVYLLDTPAGYKVRRLYSQVDGTVLVRADRPDVPEQRAQASALNIVGRVIAFQGRL